MSNSVGLSVYSTQLSAAKAAVLSDSDPTDWAIFTYEHNELKPVETGSGGLSELEDEWDDGKIMYGFAKVTDRKGLPRYVLISWIGEGVPSNLKGMVHTHQSQILQFFNIYHIHIVARSSDDVVPEEIKNKVYASSGANYVTGDIGAKAKDAISVSKPLVKKTPPVVPGKPASATYANRYNLQNNTSKPQVSSYNKPNLDFSKPAQPQRPIMGGARPLVTAVPTAKFSPAPVPSSGSKPSINSYRPPSPEKESPIDDRTARERELASMIKAREERELNQGVGNSYSNEHKIGSAPVSVDVNARKAMFNKQDESSLVPKPLGTGSRQGSNLSINRVSNNDLATGSNSNNLGVKDAFKKFQNISNENLTQQQPTSKPVQSSYTPYQPPAPAPVPVQSKSYAPVPVITPSPASAPFKLPQRPTSQDVDNNDDDEWDDAPASKPVNAAPFALPPREPEQQAPIALPPREVEPTPPVSQPGAIQGTGYLVRALYDYDPQEENEIQLIEGQIVEQVEKISDEWWQGVYRGVVGVFPSNYVEEIGYGSSSPVVNQAPNPVPLPPREPEPEPIAVAAPPPLPAREEVGLTAVALYDFDATASDELTIRENDVITNVDCASDEWWSGTLNGVVGLFPANFVELR